MVIVGNQAGFGMNRGFYNTMAIALMVTVLTALLSPGFIRQWFFSDQIKKMKDFCQHVKAGRYNVILNIPNESNSEGNENELADLMRDMNWVVHRIKVNETELRQAVIGIEQSRAEIQAQKKELEEVNAEQLVTQRQLEKLSIIFRVVHTWKGTFGQLGIHRVSAGLHELESALARLRDESQGDIEQSDLIECFAAYQPETLYGWLEQELDQLKKILGDQFFLRDETIIVENCKLYQLEEKIQRLIAPCQARTLIEELRRLRYKPFSDLLNMFPEYIANVALQQGKEIVPLVITDTKTLVDPVKYHDFAKSLVHVFRNAVAHGLETPDERLELGKVVQGTIICNIDNDGENLRVTIADNGRGINAGLIRRLAVAKGICSESMARSLSDEAAVRLIFADGFSSTGVANELSGRGVGLYAVQQEVEKLGGRIEIITELGHGTKFTFLLPLSFSQVKTEFDVFRFGEQVVLQAKDFLQSEFSVLSLGFGDMEQSSNVVTMRNISTFIDIKGDFVGRLMISADEVLARRLADCYLNNSAGIIYETSWLESAFAEFFNTTVGNSMQKFPDWQEGVNIGTPVTIWAEGASAKYVDADIYSWKLTTEMGQLYFSLISFMKEEKKENGTCVSC